jgi:tetratricopeptide (TPR) repeat protein
MAKKNKKQSNNIQINKTEEAKSLDFSLFDNQKLVFAVLIFWILLIYLRSIGNGFVGWDDNEYVYENPDVLNQNWGRLLRGIYEANWHPVTMISLGINALFGTKASGFIFVNILVHVLNTILTFKLISILTNGKNQVAFWVAVFFGIHPMHVESVAWVSERKDVLYIFFLLLASIHYLKNKQIYSSRNTLLVILFFVLSCLSKGMAVILPLILVMFDYWEKGKIELKDFSSKWYLFFISVVFGLITIAAQGGNDLGGFLIKTYDGSAINTFWGLGDKLIFAGYGFSMYIFKMFIPFGLHHFYAYPYVNAVKGTEFYLLPFLTTAILAYWIYSYKKNKLFFFSIGFFVVSLILVLQILAVGNAIMAERYTYLAYTGLLFGLFYSLRNQLGKSLGFWITLIIALVFSLITFRQTYKWKDTVSLLENSYPYHPDDGYLGSSLATFYAKNGRMDDALKICDGPLSRGSDNFKFYEIAGNSFFLKKDYKKAIELYSSGLAFAKENKDKSNLYINLGIAQSNIEPEKSIASFTQAYNISKEPSILKTRGNAYIILKKYKEALDDFNEVYRNGLANDSTFTDMAVAKYELGDQAGAVNDLQTALKINPANQAARNNLKALGLLPE